MRNCAEIFDTNESIYSFFNTLTWCLLGLENRKLWNTFYKPFTRKLGCSKVYFLIWNYFKIYFLKCLIWKTLTKYQKHIFQINLKDRMTHFNISGTVKNHRDNKIQITKHLKLIIKCNNFFEFQHWGRKDSKSIFVKRVR